MEDGCACPSDPLPLPRPHFLRGFSFPKKKKKKAIAPIATQVFEACGEVAHTQITVDAVVTGPQFPPQTQTLYVLQVPSEGYQ